MRDVTHLVKMTHDDLIAHCVRVEAQRDLAEMSNSALKAKLAQVQKTSKSRLERMKRRGKLLDEAQRTINRLQREAHGG